MGWKSIRPIVSTTLFRVALALTAWGMYGMATVNGSNDDANFYLSDDPAAFFWDALMLMLDYLMRFRLRLYALGGFAVLCSVVLGWSRLARDAGPATGLLNGLVAVCAIVASDHAAV